MSWIGIHGVIVAFVKIVMAYRIGKWYLVYNKCRLSVWER